MRIAILNLPIDNNYGGNLQRFALVRSLQKLGHEPEHVQIRFCYCLAPWRKPVVYLKRLLKKILIDNNYKIKVEYYAALKYQHELMMIEPFYSKYIPHTGPYHSLKELKKIGNYDVFIVGSDQVWRKTIAAKYLKIMFGENLPVEGKRIGFAVSFGTDKNELSKREISYFKSFYERFSAVSVREKSALKLLDEYGWHFPQAVHLLDPVFLLAKEEYQEIINSSVTEKCDGNLFCYILDKTEEKQRQIDCLSSQINIKPYYVSLNSYISIEQWLRSFNDAEYVVTDSFHGLAFSLIFNKPYRLVRNSFRGNARFDSLLDTFGLNDDGCQVDWNRVNQIIRKYRSRALSFLDSELS